MATEEAPSWDDMEDAQTENNYDGEDAIDGEWIELEAGEPVVGTVVKIDRTAGKFDSGLIALNRGPGDTVLFWLNKTIKDALDDNDLGVGSTIGVMKHDTGETWENEDGEEKPSYEYKVRKVGEN